MALGEAPVCPPPLPVQLMTGVWRAAQQSEVPWPLRCGLFRSGSQPICDCLDERAHFLLHGLEWHLGRSPSFGMALPDTSKLGEHRLKQVYASFGEICSRF